MLIAINFTISWCCHVGRGIDNDEDNVPDTCDHSNPYMDNNRMEGGKVHRDMVHSVGDRDNVHRIFPILFFSFREPQIIFNFDTHTINHPSNFISWNRRANSISSLSQVEKFIFFVAIVVLSHNHEPYFWLIGSPLKIIPNKLILYSTREHFPHWYPLFSSSCSRGNNIDFLSCVQFVYFCNTCKIYSIFFL